uniref:26S proteasome non-ATPase regulatory subunit 6 n=1 Tax=Romanomermis culicivorax TaxID=13658 RepID=A0A915KN18_ROMCU
MGIAQLGIDLFGIPRINNTSSRGGDWDRKNRLKAYEGLYCLSVRDFKKAADLFLDSSSTFTSTELMTYEQLVFYSVISSMLTLDRNDIREKVIKGAEIQEQLHIQKELHDYLTSLYDCNYAEFFVGLNNMEPRLKYDRFLAPHYIYYCRAMRTKAYKQLISSYSSINLKYIAELFNVTEEYIDKEFHQLIATGQLSCKIDGVSGVVETSQADTHTHKYTEFVKHSDILLNRIQKLSHVINN